MDTHDRTTVVARDRSTLASVLSGLALVLSIVALALAWMAYDNASDENLSESIEEKLRGTTQTEQRQTEIDSRDMDDDMLNNDVMAPEADGTVGDDSTVVPESDPTLPENNQ